MIDIYREDMDAVVEKAEEMFQMLDAGGDWEVSQVTNICFTFCILYWQMSKANKRLLVAFPLNLLYIGFHLKWKKLKFCKFKCSLQTTSTKKTEEN